MSESIDFKMILASSVHDMKNTLGLLLHEIEDLLERGHGMDLPWQESLKKVEYQASCVNNELIQLLSLYKVGESIYPLCRAEQDVLDFLDDQIIRHRLMADRFQIELCAEVPECMAFAFDATLLSSVLHDVILNALKHAKRVIRLRGVVEGSEGVISVEDDGPGYPQSLLDKNFDQAGVSDVGSGSTGLGLYFAHQVANLHRRLDRPGRIVLDNAGPLRGGRFRIFIPL